MNSESMLVNLISLAIFSGAAIIIAVHVADVFTAQMDQISAAFEAAVQQEQDQ